MSGGAGRPVTWAREQTDALLDEVEGTGAADAAQQRARAGW